MSDFLTQSKFNLSQAIREVSLGKPEHNCFIGGQKAMPFVSADGNIPHKAKLAIEIPFTVTDKYPDNLRLAWKDVIDDKVQWALKAKSSGTKVIALRLTEYDAFEEDINKNIETIKQISEATNLPLCVLGINNRDFDKKYLPVFAEALKGINCLIGAVEEETYKSIVPVCRDNGHCIIARTPIDVNLAKQLNILITELDFDPDKIVMDPNMGGLGYGLDYAYSVIEKIRIAAFEGDQMLNMPIVVFSGEEAWRTKEAKSGINDKAWGDSQVRSNIWETLTTSSMLLVGADMVIMKYPPSVSVISNFIGGHN